MSILRRWWWWRLSVASSLLGLASLSRCLDFRMSAEVELVECFVLLGTHGLDREVVQRWTSLGEVTKTVFYKLGGVLEIIRITELRLLLSATMVLC